MSIWLAFDAGSPCASAAVAHSGALLAEVAGESRSGPSQLHQIDDCLRRAGIAAGELAGIVALSGPGSFTGIRVTLATALGLRAALAAPVLSLTNLAGLALSAVPEETPRILALIDALRDEWFVQQFRCDGPDLRATDAPARLSAAAVAAAPGTVLAAHHGQPLPAHLAELPVRRTQALATAVAVAASAGRLDELLSADLEAHYLRAFTPRDPRA